MPCVNKIMMVDVTRYNMLKNMDPLIMMMMKSILMMIVIMNISMINMTII